MKKLLKRLLIAVVALAILAVSGLVALRIMFPPEKVKTLLTQYAQKNWNREITFDSLSLNAQGLQLNGFALSEEHTFAQGPFISAKQVIAKVALKPLLKKRIEIHTLQLNGVEINFVKRKDGTFNFASKAPDSSLKSDSLPEDTLTTQSEAGQVLVLQADRLHATDCRLVYLDQTTNNQTIVDNFNLTARQFNLSNPFDLHLDFTTKLQQENKPDIDLPLSVDGKVNLAGLDWSRAQATVENLTISYKTIILALRGTLDNFTSPNLDLQGTLNGINNAALADLFPNLSPFSLAEIALQTQTHLNLANSKVSIPFLKLTVKDNQLQTQGYVDWNTPAYDFTGTVQTDLPQLVQMAQSAFQPAGRVDGSFQVSSRLNDTHFSGKFNLQDVAFLYDPFTLEKLKGTLTLTSLSHWSGALTGLLNQENFVGNFDYQTSSKATDLVINATLDKLVLTQWPSQGKAEDNTNFTTTASTPKNDAQKLLNLQTNFEIGEILVPHFQSAGLTLSAALTNLSDTMTQANGTLNFSFKPGAITELDKLVKENKFVKIILLPLSILRKVSNTLNLGLFPTEGEKGTISFSRGEGAYTFIKGVMNVDKTTFASTVTTINGSGTIDFPKDKIDMKATATLLTEKAPIVIKISGTPQNPKGKLDVGRTIGSVLEKFLSENSDATATSTQSSSAMPVDSLQTDNTLEATSSTQEDSSLPSATENISAQQPSSTSTGEDSLTNTVQTLKDIGNLFKKK